MSLPQLPPQILKYTVPQLTTGKVWFISFYAWDPERMEMRRKRIRVNTIKSIKDRRIYCRDLIQRLTEELSQGWNPWIEQKEPAAFYLFQDVIDHYKTYIDKMYKDSLYREDTYIAYCSNIRNVEQWNRNRLRPISYIYQFDKRFCVDFLEEIFIGRDNSAFTRDNYLRFLGLFSKWCINHGYMTNNPTDGITSLGRRSKKKVRDVIPAHELDRLTDFLQQTNKHFLLACYILYYCFIRPKEMSMLRLKHISLARQTIFVPDTISKNRKDGTITLPKKVIELMFDLNLFSYSDDCYLFSNGLRPGKEYRSEKQFRDYWLHTIRKKLGFPEKYKFYSLKDTGITNMLRHYDVLSVRDQARHSSILMTDIYTPHDIQEANDLIKNYEDRF